MHPPGGAARLVAEFADVPPADKLVLRGGLIWDREYFKQGMTPANIRVETADARALIDLNISPGITGQQRVETGGEAISQTHTVKLSVASDNPESRDVCVDLIGQRVSAREGA
jgi:hypothetical protein